MMAFTASTSKYLQRNGKFQGGKFYPKAISRGKSLRGIDQTNTTISR